MILLIMNDDTIDNNNNNILRGQMFIELVKQYYSFDGVPSEPIVRKYSNEYQKE